ncbi:MAG: hypothetical protein PSX36_09550 [bacterium]|nr:hypothetical protein [bacterium]
MIEILLLLVVGVGLIFGLRWGIRSYKGASERQGSGITKKYLALTQLLKAGDKIEGERIGAKSISFKIRSRLDTNNYVLTEVDGRLIIVWTLESSMYGRRGKEWSFHADYNQVKMFEEIENDLKHYQLSLPREAK